MSNRFLTIEKYTPQRGPSSKVLWTLLLLVVPIIIIAAWVAIGLNIEATQAAAGVPHLINYQGKLASSTGIAIPNGSYNFHFSLWDASSGGNMLWEESWSTASSTSQVSSTWGIFSVALGTHVDIPASIFTDDNVYLQVEFDSDGNDDFDQVFSPRKQLTAVPYALNAEAVGGYQPSTSSDPNTIPVLDGNGGLTITGLAVSGNSPHNYEEVSSLSVGTNPWDVAVYGDYIFVPNNGDGTMSVLDVSDPFDPALVTSTVFSSSPRSIVIDGDYAYVSEDGGNLNVFNISDPLNPSLVTSTPVGFTTAVTMTLVGSYLYIPDYSGGNLYVVDIIDPSNPTIETSIAVGNGPTMVDYSGGYAFILNINDSSISVAEFVGGQYADPAVVTTFNTTYAPTMMTISGNYAYVSSLGNDIVTVLDISDPLNIQEVAFVDVGDAPTELSIIGNYLLVLNSNSTFLSLLDISDPANPVLAKEIDVSVNGWLMAVDSQNIYIANQSYDSVTIVGMSGINLQSSLVVSNVSSNNFIAGDLRIGTAAAPADLIVSGSISLTDLNVAGNATITSLTIGTLDGLLYATGGVVGITSSLSTLETDPIWGAASGTLSIYHFADQGLLQWSNDAGYLTTTSADSLYVDVAGDTMTGALTVNNIITVSSTGYINVASSSLGYWLDGKKILSVPSDDNLAIGEVTLMSITSGQRNTGVGSGVMLAVTTGNDNTAIGVNSLAFNVVGGSNTATGRESLYHTTGDSNSALGYRSGYALISGNNNVFLGSQTGVTLSTGSLNILIGAGADTPTGTISNFLNIGDTIYGDLLNDHIGIGTTSTADFALTVAGDIGPDVSLAYNLGSSTARWNDAWINTLYLGSSTWQLSQGDDGRLAVSNLGGAEWLSILTDGTVSTTGLRVNGTTTTTRLYVSEGLGIGTSTPTAGLAISGNVDITGNYMINGQSIFYSDPNNYYAGYSAGNHENNLSSSTKNVAIGSYALGSNIEGINSVAIGYEALRYATSSQYNTAIGLYALKQNLSGAYNVAIGSGAMQINTTGELNVAIGNASLQNNTIGGLNTAIGNSSLNLNQSGNYNTANGYNSLFSNQTGSENSAFGSRALIFSTSSQNSAFGSDALSHNINGSGNVAVGYAAGVDLIYDSRSVTDDYMVFIGANASRDGLVVASTTKLTNSIAIGYNAKVGTSSAMALGGLGINAVNVGINTSTPSHRLTVVGDAYISGTTTASCFTIDGVNCITGESSSGTVSFVDLTVPTGLAVSGGPITSSGTLAISLDAGYEIPLSVSTTDWNTAYLWGDHALGGYLTSSALSVYVPYNGATTNTNLGVHDLYAANIGIGTTTPNNRLQVVDLINFNDIKFTTLIGYEAGHNVDPDARFNTFFGYQAGWSSSTYGTSTAAGNTAIGFQTLYRNTSGDSNTAVGNGALFHNDSGEKNTAIGAVALYQNTSGRFNTAVGYSALETNTSGDNNAAFGQWSLYSNQTGANNTALGLKALYNNDSGSHNTAVGQSALLSNTTSSKNTAIGFYALSSSTGNSNVALGYFAGGYELGSNAFYVDNQDRGSSPGDKAGALLYGTFSATPALQTLRVNASTTIAQELTVLGTGISSFAGTISSTALQVNGNATTTGRLAVLSTSTMRDIIPDMTDGTGNVSQYSLGASTTRWNNVWTNNIYVGSSTWQINQGGDGRLAFTNLGGAERFAISTSGNLSIAGTVSTTNLVVTQFAQRSSTSTESAILSSTELATSTGWSADGWTGDFNVGFTPILGSSTPLSHAMTNSINELYQISYTISGRTAGYFKISFGGVTSTEVSRTSGSFAPKVASANGPLVFTPYADADGDFNGTISNVSIKKIMDTYDSVYGITDNSGTTVLEVRSSPGALGNTFIGKNSGYYNTAGKNNTTLGAYALQSNTSGHENSAIGTEALRENTIGYENTAQGYRSMLFNTAGYFNTAQGAWSLYHNTTGYGNTAQGMNALYANTTGYNNVAVGSAAMFLNDTGYGNVAQGSSALYYNTTGTLNTAQGNGALSGNKASYNTAQGASALAANVSGQYNTAVGYQAGYDNDYNARSIDDNRMLFLGAWATRDPIIPTSTPLSNGIAIGYYSRVAASNTLVLGAADTVTTSAYTVKVGIGTSSPSALLQIFKRNPGASENMLLISTSTGNLFRFSASGTAYAADSWQSGNADYAEYFYTRDTDLSSGEAVCVDVTKNNAVVRCTRAGDDNIMGIVSTRPAIVGNSKEAYENNPNYKIVAMLGQIPTKASTENGEIRPGDYLTAASIPGYVMKAGAGDATVGVALEGLTSGDGLINVMISRRNKSLTVEQIEDAVTKRIADMELEDEVNIMLADTIKSYDFTDDIAAYLNPYIASVDAKLALLTDTLSLKVGELASTTLGADNALTSQIMAANNLISVLNEQVSTTASNLSVTNAKIEGLDALVLDHSDRLTALELFTSSSIADLQSAISNLAVSTSSLEVSDNALTAGTLVVTEAADFIGTITVRGEANFEAKVTFKKPIELGADSAGTATIKAGEKFIEVKFSENYESQPKVVANLNNDDESLFISYKIAGKTTSSFKIILAEPAEQDLNFDWLAFAATSPATSTEELPPIEPIVEEPIVEELIVIEEEPVVENLPPIEPIVEGGAIESPAPVVEAPATETPVIEPEAPQMLLPETSVEAPAADPVAVPETPSAPEVVAAN